MRAPSVGESGLTRKRALRRPQISWLAFPPPPALVYSSAFHMPVGLLLQVLGTSLVACALLTAGAFVALRRQYQQPSSVNVVVLGDIARSPRTCNHARSLLEKGWTVQLLGYTGACPVPVLVFLIAPS